MEKKLLTPKNFTCDRYCGECCKKALVPLRKEDIARIKRKGHESDEFVMTDPFIASRKLLKKDTDGWCVFLKKSKLGRYTCTIHSYRPWACRHYPFFLDQKPIESCVPHKLYPSVFATLKKRQSAL